MLVVLCQPLLFLFITVMSSKDSGEASRGSAASPPAGGKRSDKRKGDAVDRVAIIGSGNWGSAIAKVIGENVRAHAARFHPEVLMWVFEEIVEARS